MSHSNGKVQASLLSPIDFSEIVFFGVPRQQHILNCFLVAKKTLKDKCLMSPFGQPDLSSCDDTAKGNQSNNNGTNCPIQNWIYHHVRAEEAWVLVTNEHQYA